MRVMYRCSRSGSIPKDSSKCLRIAATVKHHVKGLLFRNPTTFRLLLTLRFTFFLFTDYPSPVPAAAYAAAQDSPSHLNPICEARTTSCTSLSSFFVILCNIS